MKKTLMALLMIAVLGGAVWFAMTWRDSAPATATTEDDPLRHDFEAQGVVLRQLDAEGRLRFEIEAERIVQLRDDGGIIATRPTLRHDPPGTETGSPQRWVLTADEATLPADGRIVRLSGAVRARSVPAGSSGPLQLDAGELTYDMELQEVYSPGEVEFTWGGINFKGPGLRVNIADGVAQLESGHGTISL